MLVLLILSILIVLVDRVLKIVIFENVSIGFSLPLIKGIFHITPTYNKGIAFGLFKGFNLYIFAAISSLMSLFILYLLLVKRPRSSGLSLGLSLVMAGAIGNLIDRLAYGRVLDFIDLRIWPVFNIADSAITIGACLILWHLLITGRKRP